MTAAAKTFSETSRALVPDALPDTKMVAPTTLPTRPARMSQACNFLNVGHEPGDTDEYGCHYQRVSCRGTIYTAGQRLEKIYFVVSGTVKTHFQDGEMTVIADFVLPGAILGLDGLDKLIYSNSAVAVSEVLLLCIPYASFMRYSRQRPEFDNAVIRKLSAQILRTVSFLTVLARSNAEARVAFFLAELSLRAGNDGKPAKEIQITMSRRDIANHLGLAYETTIRNLNKFRGNGLITWRRQTFLIRDYMALQNLCSGPVKRH